MLKVGSRYTKLAGIVQPKVADLKSKYDELANRIRKSSPDLQDLDQLLDTTNLRSSFSLARILALPEEQRKKVVAHLRKLNSYITTNAEVSTEAAALGAKISEFTSNIPLTSSEAEGLKSMGQSVQKILAASLDERRSLRRLEGAYKTFKNFLPK